MRRMNVNRYLALQKIISLGSFSKAAEEMGYSQSATSQMIASLEKELGVSPIHRSRYGVTLTLEGKKLYPKIEQLIGAYQSVIEESNEIKGLETRTIRMGTVSSVSAHWLPGVIKKFQKQYGSGRQFHGRGIKVSEYSFQRLRFKLCPLLAESRSGRTFCTLCQPFG